MRQLLGFESFSRKENPRSVHFDPRALCLFHEKQHHFGIDHGGGKARVGRADFPRTIELFGLELDAGPADDISYALEETLGAERQTRPLCTGRDQSARVVVDVAVLARPGRVLVVERPHIAAIGGAGVHDVADLARVAVIEKIQRQGDDHAKRIFGREGQPVAGRDFGHASTPLRHRESLEIPQGRGDEPCDDEDDDEHHDRHSVPGHNGPATDPAGASVVGGFDRPSPVVHDELLVDTTSTCAAPPSSTTWMRARRDRRASSHHRSSAGHGPAHAMTRSAPTRAGAAEMELRPSTVTGRSSRSMTSTSCGCSWTSAGEGKGNCPGQGGRDPTVGITVRSSNSTLCAGTSRSCSFGPRPPRHSGT